MINTVRDINIIFKMMHERDKIYTQFNGHQLNYYPELKLYNSIYLTLPIIFLQNL